MISVVIPAHDEGAVIGRCLRALTEGAQPDELEILVVCNGCRDDTAAVAGRHGPPVRVIETPVASKSHALNLGDEAARGFPRFYVDADIELPLDSLRRVADRLHQGPVLAAAPRLEVDLRQRGWPMRAYHRIWMRLPYIREQMLGSGVYALSQAGRARFERFPDLIADDEFVRRLFRPEEKASVPEARFVVVPPRTLWSLVHIGIRRRLGMDEMRALYPESFRNDYTRQRLALLRLGLDPRLWPSLLVYAGVKAATMAAFAWQKLRGRHTGWRRDESSRQADDQA